MAQLDNAADSDSEERGFKSLWAGQKRKVSRSVAFLFCIIHFSIFILHYSLVVLRLFLMNNEAAHADE